MVPWIADGDNIDLFPESFLLKRGCEIMKGKDPKLITPKGRTVILQIWGDMPYLLKSELQRVLDDLPEASAPGRDGSMLCDPTAARVCRTTVPMSTTRSHLKHLREHMSKPKLSNVCSKYKNLPDVYYGGDENQFVTPEKFEQESLDTSVSKTFWEWYSGSSSLSQFGKESGKSHHPPIDYRYGWNLSMRAHQLTLLFRLLVQPVDLLFASPNCAPWGQDSRASSEENREQRRAGETDTLIFLAIACFFQILLGRQDIVENSGYSDIFAKSPLKTLRDGALSYSMALFDQCTCGAVLDGQFIRISWVS
jgi:hypothetical protein